MSQISQQGTRVQIAALQVAITICTLALAFIHLYGAMLPEEELRIWDVINGLGYLGLLIIFFLPRFLPRHHAISFLLMGDALLTVVVWFALGQPGDILVGYTTSAIALVLAVHAFYEGYRALRLRSMHFI
jgi:hypothetical protein